MKKLFILILALSVFFPLMAQKAKVRTARFQYMHYPKNPLPNWVKTYSTETTSTSTRMKVSGEQERTFLVLRGFEKAELGTPADVKLVFELYAVKTSADIQTKEESKKVDDKEVKVTYYFHQVTSEISGKFMIIDKNGTEVYKDVFSGSDFKNVANSDLYKTKSEAQTDYNKRKDAIISSSDNAALEKALSTYKAYMDNNYGYYKANDDALVATGKGKKHNYSDLDAALEKFHQAAEFYNSGNIEKYKELATECINVWEKALTEYDPNNKKARISKKNADWINFSIASAYLYLDDFDKAIEYMNKGQEIDAGLQSKSVLADIKDRKYRYEQNKAREEGKI
jgi:hypothetical protein